MPRDRNTLLASALGRQFTFPSELVEVDGETYEVRTPTVAARSRIIASGELTTGPAGATFDHAKMLVRAVLECTYVPLEGIDGKPTTGGATRLFADEHIETLLASPPGGIADRLGQVALSLMNVKADEVGKA